MNAIRLLRPLPIARGIALVAFALLGGAGLALAANANAVMTLSAEPIDPADNKARASVSRDPSPTDPKGANFVAAYTVSIYNPTNSSKNFRFEGDVSVAAPTGGGNPTPPTQFVSSRSDCILTQSTNPVHITCAKLEVAKGATINFRFEFRTPTAGSSMSLGASLYFPATSNGTLTASGSTSVELVKRLAIEYTLGFNTFVPTTGGTFFSGDSGTLPESPGGVATTNDPFTTTVVIPPIGFTTSALVQEKQKGEITNCSPLFVNNGCFESDISIPSDPGALSGMVIYLRIDRSRHIVDPTVSIDSAQIGYSKNGELPKPVPNCSATVVAQPGAPCIRQRKAYGFDGVPEDWQFDWEFKIDADDNGRYSNL
jgi:hypothetical protein